jgi:hypothetical protein
MTSSGRVCPNQRYASAFLHADARCVRRRYDQFMLSEEDYGWECAIRDTDAIDIPPSHQAAARAALAHLRSLLEGGNSEELALTYAMNRVPWTRYWAIWLSHVVRQAEGSPNFDQVKKQLRCKNGLREGCSVLSVAQFFLGPRLQVTFEPPPVNKEARRRPDLLIEHLESGERLYIEVTDQLTPQPIRDMWRFYEQLVFRLESGLSHVHYAGSLACDTSDAVACGRVLDAVSACVNQACTDEALVEVPLAGLGSFAVAPLAAEDELKAWALARGIEPNTLDGLPTGAEFEARIVRKLRGKIDQLPPDYPGILVIHPSPEDTYYFRGRLAARLLEEYGDPLRNRGQLLAIGLPAEHVQDFNFTGMLSYGHRANLSNSPSRATAYDWIANPHSTVSLPQRILAAARSQLLDASPSDGIGA